MDLDPFINRTEVVLNSSTDIEPFRRWWAPVEIMKRIQHVVCPMCTSDPRDIPLNEVVAIPPFYTIYADGLRFFYVMSLMALVWGIVDQLLKRLILPCCFGRTYASLSRSDKVKLDNYCLSTLHATIVSLAGIYVSIPTFPWYMFNARLMFNTTYETGALNIFSGGFFLFDFFRHLMDWSVKGSAEMLAHHVISLITIVGCSCFEPFVGGVIISYFYIFEVTTPFLHLRWFLWRLGHSTTKVYIWNGIMLVGMFFVFRVLLGTVLLKAVVIDYAGYISTLQVTMPLLWVYYTLVVMAMMLCLMQYYWFVLLIRKALQHRQRKTRSDDEREQADVPAEKADQLGARIHLRHRSVMTKRKDTGSVPVIGGWENE